MRNPFRHGAWLSVAGFLPVLLASSFVQAQMVTPGQFQVSESGAATYTIPIQVSPGVGGMEPKLSLNYSSQSGNGLLGMGWSLGGLGGVGRCPRTMAQDGVRGGVNYDSNDRYCLDGQRLIAINGSEGGDGTEYRTERESFAKIVSYGSAGNGPAWFKVWTKAGQVMEYGRTTDSRIEAQGKPTIRVWALNRIEDTKGNYLLVNYTKDVDNGDYYPSRIDYTGNGRANSAPQNSIRFTYETRPDVVVKYQFTSQIKNLVRLNKIEIYTSDIKIKTYFLTYAIGAASSRSVLTALAACDRGTNCNPTINFSWQRPDLALQFTDGAPLSSSWGGYKVLATGDFNGDGMTDIYLNFDNLLAPAYIWYGQATGDNFRLAALPPLDPSWNGYKIMAVGDFNGDGMTDIYLNSDNLLAPAYIWYGQATGDNFRLVALPPLHPSWNGYKVMAVGDFNGDGATDIYLNSDSLLATAHIWYGQPSGDGFRDASFAALDSSWNGYKIMATGDFNGDGATDLYLNSDTLLAPARVWYGQTSTDGFRIAGLPTLNSTWSGYKIMATGDFNGDGATDIYLNSENMLAVPHIWYGQVSGDGFTDISLPSLHASWNGYKVLATGDFNGDGLTDLYLNSPSFGAVPHVWHGQSSGNGFTDAASAVLGPTWNGYAVLASGDFNGDGRTDFYTNFENLGAAGRQHTFLGEVDQMPDLLKSYQNGLGEQVSITYKPLTRGDVYSKDNNGSSIVRDVQSSLYVVSSTTVSNGINGATNTSYNYGGLKADMSGRGLLGFRWMQTRQVETGLTSYTEYLQSWPYTGLPSLVKKSLTSGGNNGVLSQISNSYHCNDAAGTTATACVVGAGKRYFVYANQSVESGWDYNGAVLPVITTKTEYDIWGNATRVDVSTSDGYGKSTINSYSNDSNNWYLGRLLKSSVTSTAP